NALDLAEDIEHWLADEPVSAWPEPLKVRMVRWARQHKPLVSGAAAALLVAVLATGIGVFWYQQVEAERHAVQGRQLAQAWEERQRAVELRQVLQQALAQSGGVRQLLNEPARWTAQLQQVEFHREKAQALVAQLGDNLDPDLSQKLHLVKEHLRQDEQDQKFA